MGGGSKGGSSPNIPKPPPFSQSYQKGVNTYLANAPQLNQAEQNARRVYNPQAVAGQQQLQRQFGPQQYAQQITALQQLDPQYFNIRKNLGNNVNYQLAQGSQLDPGMANQLQQTVRGSQAARGNIYGDAPAIAEAYTLGDRGQQLYQQRLSNAAGFIGQPTIATQVGQVAPVSANTTPAYIDPNAGFQGVNATNAAYGAQAQIAAAQSNQGNSGGGWGSTIGGVVGGIAGAYFGGPVGAQAGYGIGSGLGGQVGSSFSDRRLKKEIKREGTAPSGAGIYSFAYRGHGADAPRHLGFMADEVAKVDPEAVSRDAMTGYLKVSNNYAPVEIS